jgi:peptide-methionine (R)-S-oxide reductase
MTRQINRRAMLKGSALAITAAPLAGAADAAVPAGRDDFAYEVRRSDADWRARLGDADYRVLRMGGTEEPKSSPLWNETRAGNYDCKGCGLPLYDAVWKVDVDKGWAFFRQSVPNALLMNIDWPADAAENLDLGRLTVIEVHCRRCGGHMGHIVRVDMQVLHCINGASLSFTPEPV